MHQSSNNSRSGLPQRRLGEYLLAEQLLTKQQLEQAIEQQSLYGGRLGTSLIELGLIDELEMARILSQQQRLHFIKPQRLMQVVDRIINLIPRKTALKYQVVPYHKDGKRLYVAINDAANLARLDELSFQLDHIIVPLAIPEIRLMMALNKHYGMPLSPRFDTIAAQLNSGTAVKVLPHIPEPSSQLLQESAAGTDTTASEDAEIPPDSESWPLLGESEDAGDMDIADDYVEHSRPDSAGQRLGDFLEALVNAVERDQIAHALMSYLEQQVSDCALLMVRAGSINGWRIAGEKRQQLFLRLTISCSEESVFQTLVEQRTAYQGPLSDCPANRRLQACFNGPPAPHALALPLVIRDRLVSILYLQGDAHILDEHRADIEYLAAKLEMAFKLLILRNKILSF